MKSVVAFAALILSSSSWANNLEDVRTMVIRELGTKNVKVIDLTVKGGGPTPDITPTPDCGITGNCNPDPTGPWSPVPLPGNSRMSSFIALGEKIYQIIKENRPVITTDFKPISVLPKVNGELVTEMELEGWSMPLIKKYQVEFLNGFNSRVVNFTYAVHYVSGGSFNGQGNFLTAVYIVPEDIHVRWGFTLNATSRLMSTFNHGTSENPIAGVAMVIHYTINSYMSAVERNVSFHIMGDGTLNAL